MRLTRRGLLLLPVAYLLSIGWRWAAIIPLATATVLVAFTPAIVYPLAFYATFGFDAYGITIDTSSFEALASDPPQLVEAVNRALLYGRMSPGMRQSIEVAVGTVTNLSPWTRAATAIYLVASSSQYQVQR